MPSQTGQPTILVKKSDGTTVRMTLAEIQKMKSQKAKVLAPKSFGVVPKADFSPLMEELPPTVSPSASAASSARVDQVENIVSRLSFKVSPDNVNRLRTIIQLRLKGIRDDEVTKESLLRQVIDGGLGLTQSQATELLDLCAAEIGRQTKNKEGIVDIRTLKGAPPFAKGGFPATTTPFNAFVHAEKVAVPTFKFNPKPEIKPDMRDVIPKNIQTGPIDEVRYFSLVDFRRLSTNADEAASRFHQKFINLKDESILLYLEALDAWRLSPLYGDYIDTLASALAKRQKISPQIDKSKIQMNEIKAIVNMNDSL